MATEKDVVFMDVMPEEATTDMHRLEECIRDLKIPGVRWSDQFKVEEVGYGIKKLRIACVVDGQHGAGEVDVQGIKDALCALHDYSHGHHGGHGGHEGHGQEHAHKHTHASHGAGTSSSKLVQSVELVAITE